MCTKLVCACATEKLMHTRDRKRSMHLLLRRGCLAVERELLVFGLVSFFLNVFYMERPPRARADTRTPSSRVEWKRMKRCTHNTSTKKSLQSKTQDPPRQNSGRPTRAETNGECMRKKGKHWTGYAVKVRMAGGVGAERKAAEASL